MYFNFGFRHRYYTLNDAHSLDEANFKRSGQAISMAAVEFTSTKFAPEYLFEHTNKRIFVPW